jgi:hypothetical protein
MFYKFLKTGKYAGTCETQEDRTTTVAPPNDDSKQWIWNGLNWVGVSKKLDFEEKVIQIVPEPITEEVEPAPE